MNAKRLALLFVTFFTILAGFVPAHAQTEPSLITSVVNVVSDTSPNFRSEPKTTSQSLGVIPVGALIEVVAAITMTDGAWSLLRWEHNGDYGFGYTRNDVLKTSVTTDTWQLPDCQIAGKGVMVPLVVRWGQSYVFDEFSSSCNLLVEGRDTDVQEHHIFILREGTSAYDLSKTNGLLVMIEGLGWKFDPKWNMSNSSDPNEPVGNMFVAGARRDMLAENPPHVVTIVLYSPDGQTQQWTPDVNVPDADPTDRQSSKSPEEIPVAGVADGATLFHAMIGTQGIVTVAWIDGNLFQWTNSKEGVQYSVIHAFLIPSKWTQDDINKWSGQKWPGLKITNLDQPQPAATAAATPNAS